jgi:hypothetical protein
VLRIIFGTLRQAVTGSCKKLHIDECHKFEVVIRHHYYDRIEKDIILVGRCEGKTIIERPSSRLLKWYSRKKLCNYGLDSRDQW